ncbi:hypothetical protein BJ912DRAFT_937968 [Pholiota molesta]|nr:hypothetical protein BJ912DRAFT_937968 [Pholiota molesta]
MACATTASSQKTCSTPTKAPKSEKTATKAKKKSKIPPANPDSDSSLSDVETSEDDTTSANCKIEPKKQAGQKQISTSGLFPPPGGSMTTIKSGGNKKMVWQWKLTIEVFQMHPKYSAAFAQTLKCADKKTVAKFQIIWSSKIKNCLTRMTAITHEHMVTLEQTGKCIRIVNDFDMSWKNEFTKKWSEIIVECPWYWEQFLVLQDTSFGTNEIETEVTSKGYDILNDDISRELAETSDMEQEQTEAANQVTLNIKKRRAASVASPEPEDVKPSIKTETKVTGPHASTSKLGNGMGQPYPPVWVPSVRTTTVRTQMMVEMADSHISRGARARTCTIIKIASGRSSRDMGEGGGRQCSMIVEIAQEGKGCGTTGGGGHQHSMIIEITHEGARGQHRSMSGQRGQDPCYSLWMTEPPSAPLGANSGGMTKPVGWRVWVTSGKGAVPVKKWSQLEEFSIAAQAEEQTCQKELDLNKVKIEASTRIKIENSERQWELIKAKLELKAQKTAKESAKIQAKKTSIWRSCICIMSTSWQSCE